MKTVDDVWHQWTKNVREKRDHKKDQKHKRNNKWLSFIFHKASSDLIRCQFTNCCAFEGRFLSTRHL